MKHVWKVQINYGRVLLELCKEEPVKHRWVNAEWFLVTLNKGAVRTMLTPGQKR